MPRFANPQTRTSLKNKIREVEAIKEAVDHHEPVAGHNRAILQEASADLNWALVSLKRALTFLQKWKKVGGGGRSVEQRLKDSAES